MAAPIDLRHFASEQQRASRCSTLAQRLVGSEILRIAEQVRALKRAGAQICDLSVGDFDPKQFPIPDALASAIHRALDGGETNYPPSDGVLSCREAVCEHAQRLYGVAYPIESALIGGGARPMLYAAYRALLGDGDGLLYGVPSWNNNHYATLCGARRIEVPCSADNGFLPRASDIVPHLSQARVLALNAPLNPSGASFSRSGLEAICEAVLAENHRRRGQSDSPLMVVFDHVYALLAGDLGRMLPVALVPSMARYTILIDGISKALAATGLRVGWALGPVDVINRMGAILGHVGAWAPRPIQVATATTLRQSDAVDAFVRSMRSRLHHRRLALSDGVAAIARSGLPVDVCATSESMYVAVKIDPLISAGDDLGSHASFMIENAGLCMVPFSAFGANDEPCWLRASVASSSVDDIASGIARLGVALLKRR